jgi:hypothetical protein
MVLSEGTTKKNPQEFFLLKEALLIQLYMFVIFIIIIYLPSQIPSSLHQLFVPAAAL